MIENLNETLTAFKLDAVCVAAKRYRHFGFYDLQLGPKCQISQIVRKSNEIALKIRSKSTPIVKAIPEEGIVRLQVVLGDQSPIRFYDMDRSGRPKGLLPFLLGETDDGQSLWVDMAQNPHMLIAGSTGSGKSVLLHTLIANALEIPNVKLMLSDPKGVEFNRYNDPMFRRAIGSLAQDYESTIKMFGYLNQKMEERYEVLAKLGCRSIEELESTTPMQKIFCVVDEVADLILSDGKSKKFEELIVRLAQKSRAAGIYLVLATQRPSVGVLTGLIKANFEARLSCRVSSRVDSQVIMDEPGAENLIGRGDALIKNRNLKSVRFQVAMTDPEEIAFQYGRTL